MIHLKQIANRRMTFQSKFRLVFWILGTTFGFSTEEALVRSALTFLPPNTRATTLVAASGGVITAGIEPGASTEVIAVSPGQLFDHARRVRVQKIMGHSWSVTAHSPATDRAISSGHIILATVWVRAPEVIGGKSGTARLFLEYAGKPLKVLGYSSVTVGQNWRQVVVRGKVETNLPAPGIHVSIHLGQQEQVVDIGSITVLDLGTEVDLHLVRGNLSWPGMEADAPWRAVAAERIERLRRGDLTIRVVDTNGQAVSNAAVHLRQVRRAFSFGTFTGIKSIISNDVNGNHARATISRLFDRVTVPIYWTGWTGSAGHPSKALIYDSILHWTQEQDLDVRAHVLIYPGWRFLPDELQNSRQDAAKIQAACLAHIREMGVRLSKTPLREIDVANELRNQTELTQLLGREAVVSWYAEARKAFPKTKLALNENTILTEGGETEANQKILLDWYRFLKEHGQAPDVLGFQGHFSENVTGPEILWKILDRFGAETAAELQITEYDLNTLDDQAQAAYTRDFLTACFAHPKVTAFTMWGFWEGEHWVPQAGAWKKDWGAKQNGQVLDELLTRWRTSEDTTTDEKGFVSSHIWLGRIRVEVDAQGRKGAIFVDMDRPMVKSVELTVK